ncbi:hypothetical protein K5549_016557, partial [Capra hircus]
MSSPGVDGDPKPPCLPRNGLVKLPGQPNGLGAASITKGTPAAKNRPCQPPPPTLPPPSLAAPPPRAALAGGLCPQAGLPLGPPAERPPLATDEKILNGLFWYFSACEKCVLAQVCKAWRRVLYQPKFWAGLTPVLHAKELYTVLPGGEKEFVNLQGFAARGFEGFCLVGVSDLDICEFIDNYALSKKGVKAMSLKRSTITDAGLEVRTATGPEEQGGGARPGSSHSAHAKQTNVRPCMPSRLPWGGRMLEEVGEAGAKVRGAAVEVALPQEGGSNHRIINTKGSEHLLGPGPRLPDPLCPGQARLLDLKVAQLLASGAKKEEGARAEGWGQVGNPFCCDHRCVRITDTGLSYLSTMSSLRSLYLRWCCQVQDFGLKHLLAMRSLRLLSLAGCPLLTATGLSGLVQLQDLEELELTNCPG